MSSLRLSTRHVPDLASAVWLAVRLALHVDPLSIHVVPFAPPRTRLSCTVRVVCWRPLQLRSVSRAQKLSTESTVSVTENVPPRVSAADAGGALMQASIIANAMATVITRLDMLTLRFEGSGDGVSLTPKRG